MGSHMKSKTVYIIIGVGAVGGLAWYLHNKNLKATIAQQDPALPTNASQNNTIPLPANEATQIIPLPAALLEQTSGNTGFIPPVITVDVTNGGTKAAQAVPVMQSVPTPVVAAQINAANPGSNVFQSPTGARQVDATHWVDVDGNKFEMTNQSDKWGKLFLVNGGGSSKAVSAEIDSTGHIKTKNASGETWTYNGKSGGWKRLSGLNGPYALNGLSSAYSLN